MGKFERLKAEEQKQLGWDAKRELSEEEREAAFMVLD